MTESDEYELYFHREEDTLIRAKIQSRMVNSAKHDVWVQYTPNLNESGGIAGYYCTCKTGNRTAGCCSHIASVCHLFLNIFKILMNNFLRSYVT